MTEPYNRFLATPEEFTFRSDAEQQAEPEWLDASADQDYESIGYSDSLPDAPATSLDLSLSDDQIADLLLAAADWTPLPPGPRGGHRWQNKKTGRVVDQVHNPGSTGKAPMAQVTGYTEAGYIRGEGAAKTLKQPAEAPEGFTEIKEPVSSSKTETGKTIPITQPGKPLPKVEPGCGAEHADMKGLQGSTYHLHGPQGERLFAKRPHHVSSKEYQPAQVATEMAANKIQHILGVPNALKVRTHASGDEHLLAAPLVHGAKALGNVIKTPGGMEEIRKHNSQEDLGKMVLGDWLLDAQDRHAGNFLVGQDGKVVPIDYGLSFHPHQDTDLIVPRDWHALTYNFESDGEPHEPLVSQDHPLDKEMLRRAVEQRPQIEAHARELSSHYGRDADKMIKRMGKRLDEAERLSRMEKPTIADLESTREDTHNTWGIYGQ